MGSRTGGTDEERTFHRTYTIPELKLMYVSMPKNGCTSLKLLMAELAGEDLDRILTVVSPRPTRSAGVHNHYAWRKAKELHNLDPDVRAQISPDNGWHVFAVVRDPRVRAFSAWQNKYLLQNPAYVDRRDQDWAPRVPTRSSDVVEDFARFVDALVAHPQHPYIARDRHFWRQVDLLDEDAIDYSRIYDISEMRTVISDLSAHLVSQGHPGEISLDNANDTPLAANGAAFGNGVREALEKHYAADLERFGDFWDFSRVEERDADWTEDAILHAQSIIKSNERIVDLVRSVQQIKRTKVELAAQNDELRARNRQLRRRLKRRKSQQHQQSGGLRGHRASLGRVRSRLRAGGS